MNGLPSQFQLLSNAIEFANQNHRVISQNLANVNTPDYQSRQLSFEKYLDHLEERGPGRATGRLYETELESSGALRSDGNNVDLDTEMAKMKKNDMAHQTLTQLLGAKIGIMRTAIRG